MVLLSGNFALFGQFLPECPVFVFGIVFPRLPADLPQTIR
jgi:hypothetical protein